MKKVISIAVTATQAAAIKTLAECTRASSASEVIRQALHAYAQNHSPTIAAAFLEGRRRHNTTFSGKGSNAHHGPRY